MKDNKEWAKQIRNTKIEELKQLICIYEKMKETANKNYSDSERYKKIVDNEINELENKIHILETK